MKVTVTQEDIASGMRGIPRKCPIARAMMRELGIQRQTPHRYVTVTGDEADAKLGRGVPMRTWRMSHLAQAFQISFDNGEAVEPIEFEATELKL